MFIYIYILIKILLLLYKPDDLSRPRHHRLERSQPEYYRAVSTDVVGTETEKTIIVFTCNIYRIYQEHNKLSIKTQHKNCTY